MENGRFTRLLRREKFGCALMGKVVLISLFPILLTINPAFGAPIVDPGSGHTYEVIEEVMTWNEARAAAEAMGPSCHLATITSEKENDFVVDRFLSGDSESEVWIGGRQRDNCTGDSDPSFWGVWVTGEPWSYANWNTGDSEPDDCDEQCLGYGGEMWENAFCNGEDEDEQPFLVECEPAAAVPVLNWVGMLFISLGMVGIAAYRLRRTRKA